MKKLLAVLLLCLSFAQLANAVTAWYQPTPYPMKKMDGSAMPQDINIVHAWGGWFNNSYNLTLVRDDKLQIGGWGDTYTSPIRFDLVGLPATVDSAYLYLYALPSGSANPSQVSLWPITSVWDPATVGWNNFPSTSSGYYWPVSTAVNTWRGYTISGWYADWKSGVRPDDGILIWPYNNDGTQRFDKFVSSKSTDDGHRPILGLTFTPTLEFKMPLPGGYSWLVTNEVGGYECMGQFPWPDAAHQGNNYFAIDIAWNNSGGVYGQYNTPILAAAGGKVIEVGGGNNNGDLNGFYVVIDHDSDGNINTGLTTRFLHLNKAAARANGALLSVGNSVNQGDQIGIMGTTGKTLDGNPTSTGVHLHFGVRYNNGGSSTISELTKVLMEGLLLKSYQTECTIDPVTGIPTGRIRRYSSTLT